MEQLNNVEILLIEDNPHDAELAMRALKKQNLSNNVVWLKDGQEALDFLFRKGTYSEPRVFEPPKVIFLDLKLPKIDGLEVLRTIRSDKRTKTLPVVMLTSSNQESDIIKSYDLGVNSYIVKPVNFNNFSDSIFDVGYYWMVINQPPNYQNKDNH